MQQNSLLNDWLKSRHISENIVNEMNIHWGNNSTLGECIVIPVLDLEGNFSFNKYRRNPLIKAEPKYLYDKGAKVTLYGWHRAQHSNAVLIAEGELDTLVALSANIPAITSTGGALSFQKEWETLLAGKEVTILFDNDEAGGKGMAKALDILPWAYVCFIPDRPNCKDISDYTASGGDLAELLKTRQRFSSIQDVIDDKARRASLWQSTWFHDAFIKAHTESDYAHPIQNRDTTGLDAVAKAKQYPIDRLLKFKMNKTACIWHNEKHASLHYYKDQNSVYCFGGCGKHGDAIDVYRQTNNCSFKEAVEALNKMV